MRFDSFQLTRFGRFTDRALDFPAPADGGSDLQIIAGQNEAGKSTFRAAVSEVLFGFDERTPYAFRHGYPELLLGAVIRDGGASEQVQRVKKRSHSLSRADGGPLPDSHLVRLLGGLDKTAYARQFALDHGMLVDGGKRLLESRSDLSQLLFEAASGIAEFAALQRELDAQAGRLWKKDGRSKTAYREAARALDLANKERRAAVTTGGSYDKLRRAFEKAAKNRDKARETLVALEGERTGLELLRRAGPDIAKLDGLDREIARLSPAEQPAPRLSATAGEQLEEIRRRDAVLRDSIARKSGELEELQEKLEALSLDQAALSQAAAIEALAEQRASVQRLPLDIDHRRREVEGLERQALDQARQIGWSCRSRADLRDRLPAALQRKQLGGLLQQRPALEERRTGRQGALAGLEDDLADQQARLSALPAGEVAEALLDGIDQARRLGDAERQRLDLVRIRDQDRERLEALKPALAPWSGDWAALKTLAVIPTGEAEDRLQADAELARSLAGQKQRDEEIGAKLQVADAELVSRRQQHEVVERATLQEARDDRDALWGSIRDGSVPLSKAADRYEQQVRGADALADRRFDGAEAISQTDQLVTAVAKLGAELRVAQADRDRLQGEIDQRAGRWSQAMTDLGLGGLAPARYRAWLDERRQALEALAQSERSAADLESFDQRCAEAAASLHAALAGDGCETGDPSAKRLGALLRLAEASVEQAQRVAGERKLGAETCRELERRLVAARKAMAEVERESQDWSRGWADGLAACGLPPVCGPEAAEDALGRMDRIEALLTEIERLETDRIEKMQHDLEAFAQAAQRLAEEVDPDLAADDPDQASRALATRLAAARDAESRHRELAGQAGRAGQELAEAKAGLEALLAELSPLLADAGIADPADLDGLARAIKISDQLRDLEARREAVHGDLVAAAEGRSLEDLRRALSATPAEEREVRLGELKGEQTEARQALEDSTERWTEARTALEAVSAGDIYGSAAAHAEEDRQGAIAELTTVAGDYIGAYLKAKLLRWAIDRFRAEFQSPLLTRASALFRRLTLERYRDLLVDLEPESPTLQARAAGGELVGLDGLSDGTRDQLYMALRIAAVELHLDQAAALPFIADDLLINFDNDRAAAAFQVLAELGRRTQVLYLSHHDHLVELAREALGPEVSVIRL